MSALGTKKGIPMKTLCGTVCMMILWGLIVLGLILAVGGTILTMMFPIP